jgi:DNA helicase-4
LEGELLRVVQRGGGPKISIETLLEAPRVQKEFFGATLKVNSREFGQITLRGANALAAMAFARALESEWINANIAAFERAASIFDVVHSAISDLKQPTRYPAACTLVSILRDAADLDPLLSRLKREDLGPRRFDRVATVRAFVADPTSARSDSVERFIEAELLKWAAFFNRIESNALTPEQRRAVLTDEDATLVLAGAGSGKTSVITAKAAYLINAGIRPADEILILAFAKDAAREISDRIQERCDARVSARTFHALAYEIIGKVEGTKPALAEHATDDAAFLALIKRILHTQILSNSNVANSIIRWFAHFFVEPKTEWDFPTKHAFYAHLEQQDLRTLQGEKVKSYEELQIANWLFENGIDYEYEPVYEHKVSSAGRRDYCPDFRLSESGVYIEHFGVRRQELSDGKVLLTTAPFIDRASYLAGMEWKRQVHASNGTVLIETFSYERQEGTLLSGLAQKLDPYVTRQLRDPLTIYDRVIELKQVDAFSQLLGTFLRKFKSGSYSLESCQDKAEEMKLGERAKAFLAVYGPVFEEYQKGLGGRIDFEDMVLRAAQYVENGNYSSAFRHILVDEFQDISQSRGRLVKALKAQHKDVRVFAVGDDWQSIFRFAGSDIHLMRCFGDEFGGHFAGESGIYSVVDLGRTFRSVDQIAFAARTFVLRNPAQIQKRIIPAGEAAEPAIRIVMTHRDEADLKLLDVLGSLSAERDHDTETASVC